MAKPGLVANIRYVTAGKHRDPDSLYPMKLRLGIEVAGRTRLDRLQRYGYDMITCSTDLKALSNVPGLVALSSVNSLS